MTTLTKVLSAAAVTVAFAGAAMAEGNKAPVNEVPTQGLMGMGGIAATPTVIVGLVAVTTFIASQDNKPATTTE